MYTKTENMTDTVTVEMENGDKITIELYPTIAPITVENFKKLVSEHFYDGIIFHRVISGFMIQGGDPTGTGMGGSAKKIKGEFKANGVKNDLSHKRGVISMARTQIPDSASSQFFICHADSTFLDGQYAGFGAVIDGIETVDKIASVKTVCQELQNSHSGLSEHKSVDTEYTKQNRNDKKGGRRLQLNACKRAIPTVVHLLELFFY